MDRLKEKGKKAFVWNFFGKTAAHATSFVVSVFLARILAPEEFGLVAMIMVVFSLAQVFTDVGLGSAIVQRRRVHSVHCSSVFVFNVFIGSVLTIVSYYSAPWVSKFYGYPELTALTQVMSPLFFISAISSVQTTLLNKELNYALITKIEIFSALIGGAAGIILAFNGAGVWSLVIQILVNKFLYSVFVWVYGKWSLSVLFSWKALIQLWGFGFRMFLVGLLDAVYTKMDFIIIGKLFGPASLGFFQRAKSLNYMAVQYSSGSLMTVLFPILSRVQKDLPRLQNIIIKLLGIICFITFLLFSCLYLVAEELIILIFTEKWFASAEYFKILAFSGFAYPINALLVNILRSRGKSKEFLRMAIYKKIIGSLNLAIGFIFGIEGYLYGLIIVAIINTYITIVMTSRESKIPIKKICVQIVTQLAVASIAILMTLYFVEYIQYSYTALLFIKLAIFISSYILVSWLFSTSSFLYFRVEFNIALQQLFNKVKGR